jgi:hypothetical protein
MKMAGLRPSTLCQKSGSPDLRWIEQERATNDGIEM